MRSHKLDEITTEELNNYYNNLNHSQYECAQHFGVSTGYFIKVLKERGITKDASKHAELIKRKKLERYGDCNYNNRDKARDTCVEKYGVDNPFKDTENIKQSYINKLGVEHPMKREDIKQKVITHTDQKQKIKKSRETYFIKTGYDNPGKDPRCIAKMLRSKIEHGVYDSPGTSQLERRLEKILTRKFKTVISKYRDPRYTRSTGYQYECDFYIPSEDLFIELNAHPSHYKHPYLFDEKADSDLYKKLSTSTRTWDKVLLETWSVRDVEKRESALQHSLNFIELYPTDTIFNNKSFNNAKYSDLIEYLIKKLNNKK